MVSSEKKRRHTQIRGCQHSSFPGLICACSVAILNNCIVATQDLNCYLSSTTQSMAIWCGTVKESLDLCFEETTSTPTMFPNLRMTQPGESQLWSTDVTKMTYFPKKRFFINRKIPYECGMQRKLIIHPHTCNSLYTCISLNTCKHVQVQFLVTDLI